MYRTNSQMALDSVKFDWLNFDQVTMLNCVVVAHSLQLMYHKSLTTSIQTHSILYLESIALFLTTYSESQMSNWW